MVSAAAGHYMRSAQPDIFHARAQYALPVTISSCLRMTSSVICWSVRCVVLFPCPHYMRLDKPDIKFARPQNVLPVTMSFSLRLTNFVICLNARYVVLFPDHLI